MSKSIILVLVAIVLFSGCIQEEPTRLPENSTGGHITPVPVINETPQPIAPEPSINTTPAVNKTPETKYDRFVSWLKTDETDKHPYTLDNSKIYGEQYVCSKFTQDFLKNATKAGFEVYAAGLTGAVRGQNDWHMLAAVVLDDKWYFIDPQTDQIIKKEAMFHAYGYEYAYFGKEVFISRNNAEISNPVYYHTIIGLNGQNYLYLR